MIDWHTIHVIAALVLGILAGLCWPGFLDLIRHDRDR